jgi:hypothetical protein
MDLQKFVPVCSDAVFEFRFIREVSNVLNVGQIEIILV